MRRRSCSSWRISTVRCVSAGDMPAVGSSRSSTFGSSASAIVSSSSFLSPWLRTPAIVWARDVMPTSSMRASVSAAAALLEPSGR